MDLQAINPIQPLRPLDEPANASGGTAIPGTAFSQVVGQFLNDVNADQLKAENQVQSLVTGETDNINEVMLTMTQADLSFRLAMEIRDQVISAYQEVMRMQV